MGKKNVVVNRSIEEYNVKYHNRTYRLEKYSKKEVEDFNKKNPSNIKNCLLKDRKWWLIGDTYYEVPKAPRFSWFRNLNLGCQIGLSVLLGCAVITAVTVPAVMLVNSNQVNAKAELADDVKDITITSQRILSNGALEIKLKPVAGKEIAGIDKVIVGNEILDEKKDYTFEKNCLYINKTVLDKHKNDKIIITPRLKAEFDPSKEFESDSEYCNVTFTKKDGSDYIYEISIKDEYKDSKELLEEMEHIKVGNYVVDKSEYKVKKQDDKLSLTIRGEVFAYHQGKIKIKPKVEEIETEVYYNIDWANKKVSGENTLYDLAKTAKIIKFIQSESKEGILCGESKKDKVYFSFSEDTLIIWAKDKIVFNNNDREGFVESANPGKGFFEDCKMLTSIELSNVDTSSVSDMSSLFKGCTALSGYLDLYSFITKNVVDMN